MSALSLGQPIQNFVVQATGDQQIQLADFSGKKLVLYFYPKDSTPGCTQEGQAFRDNIARFEALNAVVMGVSRDSVKSHEGFKAKQAFPFELLSDTDEALCQLFDVIKMKNMYGKQVRGIERSTFLLDENGILIGEWRKVKVQNHVEEVLAFLANHSQL
jgi:peroxiredoxin Q/BCP